MKENGEHPTPKGNWGRFIPVFGAKLRETQKGADHIEPKKEPSQAKERIQVLYEISAATASIPDLDRSPDLLLARLDSLLPYAAVNLTLLNREARDIEPTSRWHLNGKPWKVKGPDIGLALGKLVLQAKAPLIIDNVQTDPRAQNHEFARTHGLISYVGLPLSAQGEALGALSFYTKEEHSFTTQEIEFLATLAAHTAAAILSSHLLYKTTRQVVHNALLTKQVRTYAGQLEEANRRLLAFQAITAATHQGESPSVGVRNALRGILQAFGLDAGCVYLLDESKGELCLFTHEGFLQGGLPENNCKPGEGLIGHVFETGKARFSNDSETDPQFPAQLCVPLGVRDRRIGVLSVSSKSPREFSANEMNLISSMAEQLAMAVDHPTLLAENREKTIQLEKSNRVKSDFPRLISHELRTPLTAVLGYAEMLRDRMFGDVNPEQHRAVEKVVRNTYELLATIMSIMEASRIEAGEVEVERNKLSLAGLLNSLMLSYPASTLDEELTLIWDFPSDLPAIRTDGEKLKLVLQNLIDNAIKFTERGSVTLSVRCFPETNSLQFTVTDTGLGMSKQARDTIFEMFRHANGSEIRLHSGVGLGLYVVKKFTELLGGTIEVKSEPDQGSTFIITLPYEEIGQ